MEQTLGMTLVQDADLVREVPDLERRIRDLMMASPGFTALYAQYEMVDREICVIEHMQPRAAGDVGDLRKRRARLRERLCAMLKG